MTSRPSAVSTLFYLVISVFLISCKSYAAPDNNSRGVYDYSTIEGRRAQLMDWADTRYKASDHFISKAYWILGDTAVNGCKAEYSSYMVDFKNQSNDNGRSVENFVLPAIVRYLYQFEHCLSDQNIAVLRDFVAKGPCCNNNDYLGHGTLNHAILQGSSWYLLSQYFNQDSWIWKNRGEYSSSKIENLIYNNLFKRFTQTSEHGHFEIASPNYVETNFFPLLNLIDFSEDPNLKSLAESEAYKTLEYLKANSFKGKLIPPLTRWASNELNGSVEGFEKNTIALGLDKRMLWYYFGSELDLKLADFNSGKSPSFWINYVLSDWLPLDLYNSDSKATNNDEVVTDEIPTFSQWGQDKGTEIFTQKYIGENYALGSGSIRYFPYWYSGNLVEFGLTVASDYIYNQIDCTQPYWYSNLSAEPDDNNKNRWYDRSSPFMQSHIIDKNNVLFISDIPAGDPFTQFVNTFTAHRSKYTNELAQFVRCRIPKFFDTINKTDRVIQIKEGDTYIQIQSLAQAFKYETDDYYQYFILEDGKSAMHFYITDVVDSMSELTQQAAKYNATYSVEKSQIILTPPKPAPIIKMTYKNVLYKDSDTDLAEREIMYASIPLIEETSQ